MSDTMKSYPATLQINYPEESDRLTTLFRLILAIPIVIVLALLVSSGDNDPGAAERVHYLGAPGIIFLPTLLLILFRQKYPRWWFDWNLEFIRFSTRIGSYLLLLRDEYPSTDEEQAVHIEIRYPDVAQNLNRWLPLVKWFLVLPHLVVLAILWVAVVINTVLTWFIILITGNYPRGLFDFVVGVMRWSLRVSVYAFILSTDEYPPFSLQE